LESILIFKQDLFILVYIYIDFFTVVCVNTVVLSAILIQNPATGSFKRDLN